ncbi:MAG: acyl-CoA thioesterase [Muribaculaceae bacterium]|nr:acyl-CoA thioesterase [Muribaculaceae bacterium]
MKSSIELPSLSDFRHNTEAQLRFNDIDILGHVNNTVYLSLYDLGKARYMEAVNHGKVNWQRVESIIANINCSFVNQMRFGDNIKVYTRCVAIGKKSYTLEQVLADDKGEIKSLCRTIMVAYDPTERKAVEVSENWRRNVESFEGKKF